MSWSKGAVIIVKHGDPEFANGIEEILKPKQSSENNKISCRFVPKRHTKEELIDMIDDAERKYGVPTNRPKWIKAIKDVTLISLYYISLFVDKYLKIKEEGL